MGRSRAGSSKRKSSSSSSALKKKRRSQERSRKSKLGSRKSKMAYRRDDSVSFSDDDSSSSYDSPVSSSSSSDIEHLRNRSRSKKDPGGHRKRSDSQRSLRSYSIELSRSSSSDTEHRRTRSQSRTDPRGRKKQSNRKCSLRSNSSEYTAHVRKRKRSKRSRDGSKKRKGIRKKNRRIELSISSSSSTCGSSEDSDSEYERKEERLKRRGRDGRDSDKLRAQSKHRHRLRSYSSCSLHNDDDSCFQTEEKVLSEKCSSRRLRSVIVFTRGSEEEIEGNKLSIGDDQKDEIMYDHDGYPSSKSNDSNDGESRREVFYVTKTMSMKIGSSENLIQETVVSTHLSQIENLGGAQSDINALAFSKAEMDDSSKGNGIEAYTFDASANDDNLEVVLRQRALENLRKFQCGSQENAKKPVLVKDGGTEATHFSAPTVEYEWSNQESDIAQSSGRDSDHKDQKNKEESNCDCDAFAFNAVKEDYVSTPDVKRVDSFPSSKNRVGAIQRNKGTIDSSSVKPELGVSPSKKELAGGCEFPRKSLPQVEHPGLNLSIFVKSKGISENFHSLCQDTKMTVARPKERVDAPVDPFNDKPMTGESKLKNDHLRIDNFSRKPPSSEEAAVPIMSTSVRGEKNDDRSKPLPQHLSDITENIEKHNSDICTSENHNVEGQSSNSQENENEGFQKKTMSVMRGGEMVQVSYKVYIPKKTPALARRKLKRFSNMNGCLRGTITPWKLIV